MAVFDPHVAQKVNAVNYGDLILSDGLSDLLRGKESEKVSWKQVRAAWAVQLRRLADAEGARALARRMEQVLDQRLGRPLDLVWLAQEVSTSALLPVVIADLPPGPRARVLRAHKRRTEGLVTSRSKQSFWKRSFGAFVQAGAGWAVRRELQSRANRSRPRRPDLTDPVVDLLPSLGIDRAVGAVVALLAAAARSATSFMGTSRPRTSRERPQASRDASKAPT